MINEVILVGKVKKIPELLMSGKGNAYAYMMIETNRNFRNEDGSLLTDIFRVILWKGIAEECSSILKEGNIVALRGRLKSEVVEHNGHDYYNYDIIAEKVSFIK